MFDCRFYIYRASSAIAFIDPLRTFWDGACRRVKNLGYLRCTLSISFFSLSDLSLSPRLKSNARLSYRDVVEVRHMFLSKLPHELVNIILEMAQCWAYMSTECNSFLGIRASNSPNSTANFMISISEPIPEHTKVKSVRFRIRSQEYSSEDRSSTFFWSRFFHAVLWYSNALPSRSLSLLHLV